MMESYWPAAAVQPHATRHDGDQAKRFNSVAKVILSKSIKERILKNMIFMGSDITEDMGKLKEMGGKNILMFGSTTAAHALMEHNLIDDSWLFVNPVILGKGVPVFTSTRQPLKLLSARTFSSGVVVLHYERETQ